MARVGVSRLNMRARACVYACMHERSRRGSRSTHSWQLGPRHRSAIAAISGASDAAAAPSVFFIMTKCVCRCEGGGPAAMPGVVVEMKDAGREGGREWCPLPSAGSGLLCTREARAQAVVLAPTPLPHHTNTRRVSSAHCKV